MLRRAAISLFLTLAAASAVARTRPHYGGTLRVETEQDPTAIARHLILEGLTAFGSDGLVHPALSAEWQSDAAQHRWQFHLRPGIRFHDGTTLTAAAVVTSLSASCMTSCPWKSLRASGASVVITTESSQPNLPAILADDEFLISLHPSEASGASASLIGTGPFQFTSASNGTLTLTSNETHWQGRPFIDSIQIRGHKDIRTQWLDLASGRADLVEVPPEQMRAAQQQRLNILTLPASQLLALRISTSGSLSNDNLRAALAYSVDRGALANVIFQKQGQPTASLLPQSLSGYSFLFPLARDLDKARALLAGTAAPRLTLASDADGAMQVVAQRLALNLRDAGFSVQVSSTASPTAELRLSTLPITGSDPSAALAILLRKADLPQPTVSSSDPTVLYRAESDALRHNTIVPLIALPRSWAISARVVDLALLPDGRPDLASAWLEAPR